jgi:hypothetical protein
LQKAKCQETKITLNCHVIQSHLENLVMRSHLEGVKNAKITLL